MTPTQPQTKVDRAEQIIRFVERMREPDIVAPDEEYRLRHLLSLHEEEAVSEYRKALRELVEEHEKITGGCPAHEKARAILQEGEDQVPEPER